MKRQLLMNIGWGWACFVLLLVTRTVMGAETVAVEIAAPRKVQNNQPAKHRADRSDIGSSTDARFGSPAEAPFERFHLSSTVETDGEISPIAGVTEEQIDPDFVEAPELFDTAAPSGACQCEYCRSQAVPSPAKPVNPWKPLFFDNDFSDKDEPGAPHLLGERLKDIPLTLFDGWWLLDGSRLSYGGEFRHRRMNEKNRLRVGGPGRSTYNLFRWRNYLDFHAGDHLRLYVEMIDASSFNQDLPPQTIDINRWDIQNAFIDVNLGDWLDRSNTFRFGRQELFYGNQRLVSPLDWANTRRNFEGFKLISKGAAWDVDAFVVRPVNVGSGHGPVERFRNRPDRGDTDRTFSGVYSTYHEIENLTVDLYWLWLYSRQGTVTIPDGDLHTVGSRWEYLLPVKNGCCEVTRQWRLEMEGAYQFGRDRDDRDVQAGMFTTILQHTWKQLPWQPSVLGLYYWGSGDRDPNDNRNNTFNVLFPLGHGWWGILDNVSGQNLQNYSIQAELHPTEKLTLQSAMHWFQLARTSDVLYNVGGAPVGVPFSGRSIGQELDLISTYTFNPNFSVQTGYSWFWNGTFIRNNAPRGTATQFYVQTTLRY